MRNMSFALTTQQMVDQTKDVTRRLGWLMAKAGDMLQPVEKGMGLKPGEVINKITPPILILDTRREPLRAMTDDLDYGFRECRREGFREMKPAEFVEMFCATHKGCTPDSEITRIAFNHDPLEGFQPMTTAPKDGTTIRLLLRHINWHYCERSARPIWEECVEARWLDFNDGGWTWRGMVGEAIAWSPK